MSVIKSFSVGDGDLCYIRHGSDNFSIIDCNLTGNRDDEILDDLAKQSKDKGVTRFISTHPDQDHFEGIEKIDDRMSIRNFYVVKNQAIKEKESESFKLYKKLRDGDRAYYIHKGCTRKWMNRRDDVRGSSGISVLWPDMKNKYFKEALEQCNSGESYNNVSAVVRYKFSDGASFMWLGDLETDFMKNIEDSIELEKTTIVFAAHHARKTGKIPNSWLQIIDPQFIIIGEAPTRHLNYYTGYNKITQNSAGDITMDVVGNKVHFYVSNENYSHESLDNEGQSKFPNYIGSITVETEYTLDS